MSLLLGNRCDGIDSIDPVKRADTFAMVTRADLIAAGRALGLPEATAQRQLDAMLAAVPAAAARLTARIEADSERDARASPAPEAARAYIQGELRMLRAIDRIVIREMTERLA